MTETAGDFPGGVRCMDCDRALENWEPVHHRLIGMNTELLLDDVAFITEIICTTCDTKASIEALVEDGEIH